MADSRDDPAATGGGQDMAAAAGEYAADNIRALPVGERRGFTQVDNAYYDDLFGKVSPTAYYCLSYLVRNIIGYRHRDSMRLSFKQLGDALGLSRNTAMKGLQELEASHIIGSDGAERGRTQIRAYFLLPIEEWTLDTPAATSAKNEQVPTSPNSALVVSKIGLVEAQTSPKIGHLINTKRNTIEKKDVANATDGAQAPVTPAASSPEIPSRKPRASRPRKLTDEQLEAHRIEQGYVGELMTAYKARLKVKSLPAEGKERQAAHWFYTALDGASVPVEEVMAVYDLTKRQQWWRGKHLSLLKLGDYWLEYHRDPEQYRRECAGDGKPRMRPQPVTREPQPMPVSRGIPLNAKPASLDHP